MAGGGGVVSRSVTRHVVARPHRILVGYHGDHFPAERPMGRGCGDARKVEEQPREGCRGDGQGGRKKKIKKKIIKFLSVSAFGGKSRHLYAGGRLAPLKFKQKIKKAKAGA